MKGIIECKNCNMKMRLGSVQVSPEHAGDIANSYDQKTYMVCLSCGAPKAFLRLMNEITMADYIKLRAMGSACPLCGGDSIDGGAVTIDGDEASQKCVCYDCDREFEDVYKLVGVRLLP